MSNISLKYYTNKVVFMYMVLLLIIPMIFGYPMEWFGYVWGIVFVLIFFLCSNYFNILWRNINSHSFKINIYWTSFTLNLVYVLLSYWFYLEMTGDYFEFSASDSTHYHLTPAATLPYLAKGGHIYELISYWQTDLSDSGFYLFVTILYWVFFDHVLVVRIADAFLCAGISVYVYRIAQRHFSDSTAKLASILCAFCPYLTFYCGLHLKEILMTFLTVLFVDSADVIIVESKKWQKWIPLVFSGIALFAFRTVLGAVAFLAFFATLLFSSGKQMGWGKRILIIVAAVGVSFFAASEKITQEIQDVWNAKDNSQQISMEWRSKRKGGNELAKYASAAVFAPLIFTIPFPSMVYTEGQENIRLTNGANYVKNITSFFTVYALIMLIVTGDWRRNVLVLSFTCGYLIVIAFSSFAQSGRFHVPVMPFEMMLAAYGVSVITKKHRKFFNMWLVLMFVACIAWQWFKLKGRGMI